MTDIDQMVMFCLMTRRRINPVRLIIDFIIAAVSVERRRYATLPYGMFLVRVFIRTQLPLAAAAMVPSTKKTKSKPSEEGKKKKKKRERCFSLILEERRKRKRRLMKLAEESSSSSKAEDENSKITAEPINIVDTAATPAALPVQCPSEPINMVEHQGFDEYQIRVFKLILLIKNDLFLKVSRLFKHVL